MTFLFPPQFREIKTKCNPQLTCLSELAWRPSTIRSSSCGSKAWSPSRRATSCPWSPPASISNSSGITGCSKIPAQASWNIKNCKVVKKTWAPSHHEDCLSWYRDYHYEDETVVRRFYLLLCEFLYWCDLIFILRWAHLEIVFHGIFIIGISTLTK